MRNCLRAKVAVAVLVLVVGVASFSVFVGPVAAYRGGSYRWGGRYYYSWGWYYPYYSYYPYYPYYSYYSSQPAQYQLTVNADPSSASGQATGGGSYSYGSTASFSAQNVIQASQDTRYVFVRWSGDYSGSTSSGSVTMDSSKTVTAIYQTQYLLTVTAQPANVPSPQGGGWYNAGDTATLTAPSLNVGGSDGSRLLFSGWSVDGNNQAGSPLSLQMNAPHTVTAQYKQQYYLTVSSDRGVTSGSGWYDAGTTVPINVSTPPGPSFGVNFVFNGWQGGVTSSSQSTQVVMDGPKTVTATWRTDSTVLYVTIAAFIVAILLVAGFFFKSQRRSDTSSSPGSNQATRQA